MSEPSSLVKNSVGSRAWNASICCEVSQQATLETGTLELVFLCFFIHFSLQFIHSTDIHEGLRYLILCFKAKESKLPKNTS